MIALVISLLIAAYLLVPNALFRFVLGLFFPLRVFQERRTEDLTLAVVTLVGVFGVALFAVWHVPGVKNYPLAFSDTSELRSSDYRLVFSSLYSEPIFKDAGPKFWEALSRTARRQLRFVCWYYIFVILWAWLSAWLSKNYHRFKGHDWYSRFADFYLLRHISQWYVLLTPFVFGPRTVVKADVLMSDDTLYRGDVAQHFSDKDGNLSGLILTNPTRFDRRTLLRDRDIWGTSRPMGFYWHSIPSAKLYLVAEKIVNLNLNYSPPAESADKVEVEKYVEEVQGKPVSVFVMTEPEFLKTVKRTEDAGSVTYDVRSFGDQQQMAVAWYLGNLIFKSSISKINTSKAVLVLVDSRFETTPQLDGFVGKLKALGLNIEVRSL